MKLLIDGYNLFKQVGGVTLLSPVQRAKYIKTLARYVQLKRLSTLLVFDGGMQERASYEEDGLLEIVYVGKNKTADDFIKDFLQTYGGDKDILLVSSDRELNKMADYCHLPSIDVFDFWHFVKAALIEKKMPVQKSGHTIKMSSSDHPELDALMGGLKVTDVKQDDLLINSSPTALKRSKIDKKLLQKAKKL
jgi:hypothetical protein